MREQIQTNKTFHELDTSNKRISIFQGGSRSGKTYNILTYLIFKYALTNEGKTISICRVTFPALRSTVMRDFFEILINHNLYNPASHRKSVNEYDLNGNTFEFFSLDDDQKIRGRKRDVVFINEANEMRKPIFTQLAMRTTEKIILDFNPSDEYHFIYDDIITRDDCDFYKSTFKDNPFIPDEVRKEILRLKDTDPVAWQVYGLGERAASNATIFTNWQTFNDEQTVDDWCYGVDFGFNNPTSLVKVSINDGIIYVEELLYERGLTNSDLIRKFKEMNLPRNKIIFCDSAEPQRIKELYNAGLNVKPALKDVKKGIDSVKSFPLRISASSSNLIKEIKFYKWKEDKDGNVLEEPVKFNDHAVDAMRYAIYNFVKGTQKTSVQRMSVPVARRRKR